MTALDWFVMGLSVTLSVVAFALWLNGVHKGRW